MSRKIRLGVNIDHVATLRQLRAGLVDYPDVVQASEIVKSAGADQITIHLRQDRRHIQDQDVAVLIKKRVLPINLEMAATDEMVEIAISHLPDIVCMVPETREELTTEGGLDVKTHGKKIGAAIKKCLDYKVPTSLFIEADLDHVKRSADLGAKAIEIHTGTFANARNNLEKQKCLRSISDSAELAHSLGLRVHAGHGLDYRNLKDLLHIPHLEEVNIGHSIVCRAVIVGLGQAIKEFIVILERGS